ncbi:MAG: hypothetical protein ACTSR8_09420 [Promethearchaeota archaeon]
MRLKVKKVSSPIISKKKEDSQKIKELSKDVNFSEITESIIESIQSKAFFIDQKRIKDAERLEIKPDIKGLSEKIQKLISDKLFLINQKRAKDEERLQIKPNLEQVANKIESLIRDKIFYALKSKESLKPEIIEKKAFIITKKKEDDKKIVELTKEIDFSEITDKILESIQSKAFLIDTKREKETQKKEIVINREQVIKDAELKVQKRERKDLPKVPTGKD